MPFYYGLDLGVRNGALTKVEQVDNQTYLSTRLLSWNLGRQPKASFREEWAKMLELCVNLGSKIEPPGVLVIDWVAEELLWGNRKFFSLKTLGLGMIMGLAFSKGIPSFTMPPASVRRLLGLALREKKDVVQKEFFTRYKIVHHDSARSYEEFANEHEIDATILGVLGGEVYRGTEGRAVLRGVITTDLPG